MNKTQGISNNELKEQLRIAIKENTTLELFPNLEQFKKLMTFYHCATMEIVTKFNVLNEEFSLRHDRNPINSIQSRVKKVPSIYEKLKRKHITPSIETIENEINDIAGIRIVCSFVSDVYYLEKALLLQDDITLIKRKDFIKNPKVNGYQSLHLIVSVPIFLSNQKKLVKVEIQLRTIAMDAWAALEHQLKYKKVISDSQYLDNELFKCSKLIRSFDKKMNKLFNDNL